MNVGASNVPLSSRIQLLPKTHEKHVAELTRSTHVPFLGKTLLLLEWIGGVLVNHV